MLINSHKGKNKTENPNESKQIKTKKNLNALNLIKHQDLQWTLFLHMVSK